MNEPLLLSMEEKGFNLIQGMALLLLKPLNLPANYFLNLIKIISYYYFAILKIITINQKKI